jgi:hypothetical protein
MSADPFFTIISPDYFGAISAFRRETFLNSVLSQSFLSWELLLIHDGPRPAGHEIAVTDERVIQSETATRYNDWGHSLRDIGIKAARGKYILIVNPDNVIYQHTLAILHAYSMHSETARDFQFKTGELVRRRENPKVLVFGVKMMGAMHVANGFAARIRGTELKNQYILPGWPPRKLLIDAMSCAVDAQIWKKRGWYLKHEESDGDLIAEICEENGYIVIPDVLGEHW